MTAELADDDYCHRTDGACTGRACWVCDVDEPDDGECPDCLPRSMCGACADDDRFHRELDERCERR